MKTVTFSPIKDGVALKPEQYFEKYPELKETVKNHVFLNE